MGKTTARLPLPLLSRLGPGPPAVHPMTAQDHHCRDLPGAPLRRVRHLKKSELRWIREIEAGCTTASPHRPEQRFTHSVMQIVLVRALLSNEKKKIFERPSGGSQETCISCDKQRAFSIVCARLKRRGRCAKPVDFFCGPARLPVTSEERCNSRGNVRRQSLIAASRAVPLAPSPRFSG